MKKTVKTLVLFTCICLLCDRLPAQLKLPVVNAVSADVKKVIADYPNHFASLQGELIVENPQSTEYRCNFRVSGAEESFITRYSAKKTVCSWEALMLTTESFEKAKQKFRSLFNQLNNLSADLGQAKPVHFKGKYEAPEEERKFTSVLFEPDPAASNTTALKMEITLQFHPPMEWKVRVLLYDRERDDHERGKEVE